MADLKWRAVVRVYMGGGAAFCACVGVVARRRQWCSVVYVSVGLLNVYWVGRTGDIRKWLVATLCSLGV